MNCSCGCGEELRETEGRLLGMSAKCRMLEYQRRMICNKTSPLYRYKAYVVGDIPVLMIIDDDIDGHRESVAECIDDVLYEISQSLKGRFEAIVLGDSSGWELVSTDKKGGFKSMTQICDVNDGATQERAIAEMAILYSFTWPGAFH